MQKYAISPCRKPSLAWLLTVFWMMESRYKEIERLFPVSAGAVFRILYSLNRNMQNR